ncbi:MAG: RNA polymerase sigma-70 factor, partial [Leptospiraceae bacterium]|nr:RNA polymerase sigma-70 factor [Leptospiraceae bacterium]
PVHLKPERTYEELNASEFRDVFSQYIQAIRNFLYFKTGSQEMAEDLAQDTFVKLWENRKGIDKRTVKAYLYTIANNLAINQLKRNQLNFKFQNQVFEYSEKANPQFLMEMKEYEQKLTRVLEQMPEGSREVFLMNRLEDLKYREIAENLGISVKAVEKRMSKALQIIREKLNVDL